MPTILELTKTVCRARVESFECRKDSDGEIISYRLYLNCEIDQRFCTCPSFTENALKGNLDCKHCETLWILAFGPTIPQASAQTDTKPRLSVWGATDEACRLLGVPPASEFSVAEEFWEERA
jgi:hypothetical protein